MITPFCTESEFIRSEFIRAQAVRWKVHNALARKGLIQLFVVSVVLLGMGLLVYFTDHKFNPLLYVGGVFGSLTLLVFYGQIQAKRKFQKAILAHADRYETIGLRHSYEFSEEGLRYTDTEKSIEFKWTVFSGYTFYKNYLILSAEDSFFSVFLFENKPSEKEEYEKIREIIEEKVAFRKLNN